LNLNILNLRRILNLAAAFAAVAAAAAVVVVAASFAVYAVAKPYLGQAGAAAVVAGVFALIAVVIAWLATRKVKPRTKPGKVDDASVVDRVIDMAKERPLIALGAAAAAVTVLLRNPAVITAVVSAFVAGNATKSGK
jgi:Na+/melibiose symporter-like transporter